jgi:hypothetical protein
LGGASTSRQDVRKRSDGEILKFLLYELEFVHLFENTNDPDFTSLAFGYIGSLRTVAAVRIVSMNSRYLLDTWIHESSATVLNGNRERTITMMRRRSECAHGTTLASALREMGIPSQNQISYESQK